MSIRRFISVLSAALCMVLVAAGVAQAFGLSQPTLVNAAPSKATPNVLTNTDSKGNPTLTVVYAITQVGNTVVLGGNFTKVANPGSTTAVTDPNNGQYIVAFDAGTGKVNTAFAPGLDGTVNALLPGPTPNTVYVGGDFNNVAGAKGKGLILLDLTTGKRVSGFATIAMDGTVQAIKRVGNRLYVGGTFMSVNGQPHGGLVAIDALTGAVDPFVQSTVLTNHNWTPGSTGIAHAAVGVFGLDVTPDGSRLIIIGNFKTVDGLARDQIAMFDLTGAKAVVRSDWATHGYEAACYANAYDSYVRDVQFSPDGSYFVVVATGGGNNTLCDAAARFETGGSGTSIQPSWVNWSGGDSYLSVAITDSAVYVGGHQRWMNNPLGVDQALGGAVPRPGLGALDPTNGEPLAWNPGRNPRGAGAYALLATPSGLYVGSDTDYIGDFAIHRMKIAFFPLAGGQATASTSTPGLPGTVYSGAASPAPVDPSSVLYRINEGGPTVTATDGGPNWQGDNTATFPYRSGKSSSTTTFTAIQNEDPSVPTGTPISLYTTERWDSGTKGDGDEMRFAFPVPSGQKVTVRFYWANQCTCTASPGQRQFDVSIDGTNVLNRFDVTAAAGGTRIGIMRSFPITSDGTVNIQFTHEVGDPFINAIELIRTPTTTATSGGLSARSFDGTTAGPAQNVASDLNWSAVRAPVLIGGTLFYGKTDGNFYRRTFDGQTFGPEQAIDPYNDPLWSTVKTGTVVNGNPTYYRGMRPDFYGQLAKLTSMFFSDGRLYYTVSGSSSLYYRGFSPDSGIVYATAGTVPGVSMPEVDGAFLGGGNLYYVDNSNGALDRVGFTPGTVGAPGTLKGTPTVVSGPSKDGVDWRARSVFLGPGANTPPVASASASCTGLACSFDGTASHDPDGSVSGYAWSFGDGGTANGATASHTYATAGTYNAVLTVTDNRGATSSTTTSVTVAPVANQPPTAQATASCDVLTCSFDASGSSDPDGTVSSYAWDFGDGSTGSGRTTSHTYGAAGDYTATLTVTDDRGATATRQLTVSPTPPAAPGVQFRGVSGTNVLGTSATVTVPSSVQPGDLLVLNVAGAAATQTPPSGWSQVAAVTPTGVLTTVWQRVAAAGDAGSPVTVTFSTQQKSDVSLFAYAGAAMITPSAVATKSDATSAGAHTQPALTATEPGSIALWLWDVKSSSTTSLTVPAGTVSRDASTGSGTAYITTLAAESAQSVSGTVPGPTSTADGTTTTGRTNMVALVLAPASGTSPNQATPNQPPTADATAACTGLTCSFDGSGSGDVDGNVTGYAWDFGDGSTGTGATVSHTYASSGSYVVTLTVTDDKGATGTRQITVSPAPQASGTVGFRGASGTSVVGMQATVQVPASVQPGDLLILNVAGSGASAQTPPSGWTQVASVAPTGVLTTVWQRAAVAGDAGSSVTVGFGALQKADVSLLGYSGAALVSPGAVATGTDAFSAGAHTQPTVTATVTGSRALWIWDVKSSATTALTLPDGTVVRYSSTGSGTGYITALALESSGTVAGSVSGPTATADGTTTGRTNMVALVLAPQA